MLWRRLFSIEILLYLWIFDCFDMLDYRREIIKIYLLLVNKNGKTVALHSVIFVEYTICYSGSSQGIWTCIPCKAWITIIFYWSVMIKLELICDAFPDNNDPSASKQKWQNGCFAFRWIGNCIKANLVPKNTTKQHCRQGRPFSIF
jgi:hypothetical protein